MAKAVKPKKAAKKRGNYEEPLKVNGSFLDIMKAAIKHADNNSAPNKKAE
jgi:hypothetical protein